MKKFAYSICAVSFMLFLMLASLYTVGNNRNFFLDQYEKNNTIADTGMSADDLMAATDLLLDYLNDKTDSLDMVVEKWGEKEELFDSREKTHMVDVKVLYRTFRAVMWGLLAVTVGLLVYLKYTTSGAAFITGLAKAFNTALIITGIICRLLTVVFATGFNSFWTLFHQIMFTNDLWLLDPDISTMINMFPLKFWLAMCTDTLKLFAGIFGLTYMIVTFINRRKDRLTNG